MNWSALADIAIGIAGSAALGYGSGNWWYGGAMLCALIVLYPPEGKLRG